MPNYSTPDWLFRLIKKEIYVGPRLKSNIIQTALFKFEKIYWLIDTKIALHPQGSVSIFTDNRV